MVNGLDYGGIKFPVPKRAMVELKRRIVSALMCLVMKMVWFIQSMYHKKFEDCMDLLLIADENKSHHVYIQDFNRFMCNKTKHNKKHFCRYCLHSLSSERVLVTH